jgi:bifunctional non-homologous end joining protein LigD
MSQEQKIALFMTEGSSDKEYHIHLKPRGDLWVVDFANGRRGSTLRTGTKTASPVSYEAALKIYNKILKEKTSGGYVPDESGRTFSVGENAGRKSGISLQLSNPIDNDPSDIPAVVDAMIEDPMWMAQEKMDGVRCAVEISDGKAQGINRKGLYVGLPPAVAARYEAAFFAPNKCVFDGEMVGDTHYVFDVLIADGDDMTSATTEMRALYLRRIFSKMGLSDSSIQLVQMAETSDEKRALIDRVANAGGEGVVFKFASGPYIPGRPASGGNSIKHKFWESATVRVANVNGGKRSVEMEMLDGAAWTSVGNVTVPANQKIPSKGDLIEVRYLYAYQGGALFQPTLLGARTDIDEADCKIETLKFKEEPPTSTMNI